METKWRHFLQLSKRSQMKCIAGTLQCIYPLSYLYIFTAQQFYARLLFVLITQIIFIIILTKNTLQNEFDGYTYGYTYHNPSLEAYGIIHFIHLVSTLGFYCDASQCMTDHITRDYGPYVIEIAFFGAIGQLIWAVVSHLRDKLFV